MKYFTLSEKGKDRLLNIALVGSLMLLVGGFIQHDPVKKGSLPVRSGYSSSVIQPVIAKELPVYELAHELPIQQKQAAPKNIQTPNFASNTEQATNSTTKVQDNSRRIGSEFKQTNKNTQISETLTKIRNATKLNLL